MKLSGYTTTRNCVAMDYPFKESIQSLIDFCDEVVVMDSSDGSDDTRKVLAEMEAANKGKLFVYHADMDWSVANHGVYDGVLKQAAREKCTGEFLWQMDCDEVIHATDRQLLESLITQTNNLTDIPVICLPVVEYWGGQDKVRVDVNPWKWRLSRNHPSITHGMPVSHRKVVDGLVYAKPGTDTCDYINKEQGLPVPNLNFVNAQIESLRQNALRDPRALEAYEKWFNQMSFALPTVYHYSWFSIKSKIEKYKNFFGDFWKSMYHDTSRSSNVFFDVPWEQVTDEMIEAKAKELREKTGGWIFHKPWDGSTTPHVKILRNPPDIMKEWAEKHSL